MASISQEKINPSDSSGGEMRNCRCPLCGQLVIAASMEECVAHMQTCKAFGQVHPTTSQGKTQADPNMDFFEREKAAMREERESGNGAGLSGAKFRSREKGDVPSSRSNPFATEASTAAADRTAEEIAAMNVRELRRHIESAGLRHMDCVEKKDLRERAQQASSIARAKQEQQE